MNSKFYTHNSERYILVYSHPHFYDYTTGYYVPTSEHSSDITKITNEIYNAILEEGLLLRDSNLERIRLPFRKKHGHLQLTYNNSIYWFGDNSISITDQSTFNDKYISYVDYAGLEKLLGII